MILKGAIFWHKLNSLHCTNKLTKNTFTVYISTNRTLSIVFCHKHNHLANSNYLYIHNYTSTPTQAKTHVSPHQLKYILHLVNYQYSFKNSHPFEPSVPLPCPKVLVLVNDGLIPQNNITIFSLPPPGKNAVVFVGITAQRAAEEECWADVPTHHDQQSLWGVTPDRLHEASFQQQGAEPNLHRLWHRKQSSA